jgi:membrane glycosyltransferase
LFLVLSTIHVFALVTAGASSAPRPEDFTSIFGYTIKVPEAFALFCFTLLLLFLPKVISVIVTLGHASEAKKFGGRARLVFSALLEAVTSSLLAPINMMFNAKFVLFTLLGQGVGWIAQRRDAGEDGTDWREAILTHWQQTVFGTVWGVSSFILWPMFFWWLSPVIVGLVLSIPLSILLSKVSFGQNARWLGLFLTPEETQPNYELRRLEQNLAECYKHLQPIEPLRNDYGLLQAVLDPYINAMHVALLRQRRPGEEAREWFMQLRERLLREGPIKLTAKEKMALLLDAESMIWLHEELWRQPSESLADWWRLAMRQYNVLTATPVTALYR